MTTERVLVTVTQQPVQTIRVRWIPGIGFSQDAYGVYVVGTANFGYTPEGGVVYRSTNRTGAASVRGQAIGISPDYDNSHIVANNPYTVNGFVYNAGIADGEEVWIVRDGICDMLLADGFSAPRDYWLRLSSFVDGRLVAQQRPGYEQQPSSVAFTRGSNISGTLPELLIDNGTKYVMGEQTGGAGLDAVFTFPVSETMDQLKVAGYYADNHTSGVQVSLWNFDLSQWDLQTTFPVNGTQDITYTFPSLTSVYTDGSEMRVRLYHPDNGNANHRIYLDQLVVASTDDQEHFKECGHVLAAASAGTDVLVRANVHLL